MLGMGRGGSTTLQANGLAPHAPCPSPAAVSSDLASVQSLTSRTPIVHVSLACRTGQFLMHWKFTPWSGPVFPWATGEVHWGQLDPGTAYYVT